MNQTPAKSAFRGVYNPAPSPFNKLDENGNIAAFSFRGIFDVFKKKDGGTSSSTSKSESGSKSEKEGGGIGSAIGGGLLGLLGIAGSVAPILPQIGVGSKSRINEATTIAKAQADANVSVINAQNQSILMQSKADKQKQNLYIIGGVGLFLTIVIVVVLITRK
jgi:hypothetical protein